MKYMDLGLKCGNMKIDRGRIIYVIEIEGVIGQV